MKVLLFQLILMSAQNGIYLSFLKMAADSPPFLVIMWSLWQVPERWACVVKLSLRHRGKSCLWSPTRYLEEPSLWIRGQLRNQTQSHLACFPVHSPGAQCNIVSGTEHLFQASNTTGPPRKQLWFLTLNSSFHTLTSKWTQTVTLLLSTTHQLKC